LKSLSLFAFVSMFLAALVVAPAPAYAQRPVLLPAAPLAIPKGPPVSRLQNRPVWNDRGQRIGSIADFVVDDGNRLFAVLQVGGFLSLDGRLVAVPFKMLVISKGEQKIALPGASREALLNYPAFKFDD
jgi:hypothetical protein